MPAASQVLPGENANIGLSAPAAAITALARIMLPVSGSFPRGSAMFSSPAVSGMRRAVQECLDCHQACYESSTNFCLEAGGRHVEAEHYRLMLNCSELCLACAHFMMSSSAFHAPMCALCADVCEACAESCEKVGQMQECVEMCRRCASTCRELAGSEELSQPDPKAPARRGTAAPTRQ
jgi:hypothetical protein